MRTNLSLINEDILTEVELVLDRKKNVNPMFLNDISSLTEALCLSDCIAWGNDNKTAYEEHKKEYDSSGKLFKTKNINDGVLAPLFTNGGVDLYLGESISRHEEIQDFSYGKFLMDEMHMFESSVISTTGERLQEFLSAVAYFIPIFVGNNIAIERQKKRTRETILDDLSQFNTIVVPDNAIYSDADEDFIFDWLSAVEHKINASKYLGYSLGANNIVTPCLTRHTVINANYNLADYCLEGLLKKIIDKNKLIEHHFHPANGFSHMIVPDFGRLLLSNVKKTDDIPFELIRLRERFEPLRKTNNSYQKRINEANSINELDKISNELELAWTNLLKKQDTIFTTRLTFAVWDIIKKGPKMIIEALDALRKKDEIDYPIFRVSGLYNAWKDFRTITPSWNLSSVIEELFGEKIDTKDLESYNTYYRVSNFYSEAV